MAEIGISEFTFGYAFLYEQTHANWHDLRAAPILPSLQKEHEEGWDAHLPLNGIDYYYQFKLSDFLSRRNASFIADGTYQSPFYRIALHRKNYNRQHQRLRELSQTNPRTYYVAPEFNTIDTFNASFLAHQIVSTSRLIPVADCDDIVDGDQHYITFQQGQPAWIQHSEKRRHEKSYWGRDLPAIYRGSAKQWRRVDKVFAEELFDSTRGIVSRILDREHPQMVQVALPLLDFNPRERERREVLLRTAEILSVALGVTLVLVGTKD